MSVQKNGSMSSGVVLTSFDDFEISEKAGTDIVNVERGVNGLRRIRLIWGGWNWEMFDQEDLEAVDARKLCHWRCDG